MSDRQGRGWIIGAVVGGVFIAAMAFVLPAWHTATSNGGQQYAEPFQIAGNLYYVGANDIAAFLITSPQGHVLLDGGYPGTAKMIAASIKELGFNLKDVKVLISSEPHYDHAGGLAELQDSSGAELWASDASAETMATGGADPADKLNPFNLFVWTGLSRYDSPTVQHRLKDGDTVRLGPIELTAHLTPGHSRGCTTWEFPVRSGARDLRVVSACSLELLPWMKFTDPQRYPGIRHDFEHSIATLRSLSPDIWVTSHARAFGRYRKFSARAAAKDPVDPFIDPAGYVEYIDKGERAFKEKLAEQQAHP